MCLTPSTYAHVIGCSDCTIFLGPVYGVCTVEHCERVRIVGSFGRVRLVNCVDVKMNAWTGNRPILLGDCRGVVAGPLCARYPNISKHAACICSAERVISSTYQAWRHPVLTDAGGVDEDELDASVFSIQSVDDFMFEPVAAAFPSDAHPSAEDEDLSCAPLPSEYATRLAEKKQTVQSCLDMVHEAIAQSKTSNRAGGSATARSDIQGALQTAFKDWLISSGHLDSLLSKFVQVSGSSSSLSE